MKRCRTFNSVHTRYSSCRVASGSVASDDFVSCRVDNNAHRDVSCVPLPRCLSTRRRNHLATPFQRVFDFVNCPGNGWYVIDARRDGTDVNDGTVQITKIAANSRRVIFRAFKRPSEIRREGLAAISQRDTHDRRQREDRIIP